MTRVGVVSDLHLEFFHFAEASRWVEEFSVEGMDVLVLAGDIATKKDLVAHLRQFLKKGVPIAYVLGNHEHYQSSPSHLGVLLQPLLEEFRGQFHWLRAGKPATIAGLRFAGCVGWPVNRPNGRDVDGYRMWDVEHWIDREAERDAEWLLEQAPRADVIVTHIQPSIRAVAPQFIGSFDNWYFCLEMDTLIERTRPPLWVAGHTHSAWDGMVHDTRLVINPRGYPQESSSARNFRPYLTVEVQPRES